MEEKTRLVTTDELARLLKVSSSFLRRNRMLGQDCPRTIPYVRIGGRAIRYDLAAVGEYLGLPLGG